MLPTWDETWLTTLEFAPVPWSGPVVTTWFEVVLLISTLVEEEPSPELVEEKCSLVDSLVEVEDVPSVDEVDDWVTDATALTSDGGALAEESADTSVDSEPSPLASVTETAVLVGGARRPGPAQDHPQWSLPAGSERRGRDALRVPAVSKPAHSASAISAIPTVAARTESGIACSLVHVSCIPAP